MLGVLLHGGDVYARARRACGNVSPGALLLQSAPAQHRVQPWFALAPSIELPTRASVTAD
jgi:hypothetical protein